MLRKLIIIGASVAFAAGLFLYVKNKQVTMKLYHLVPQKKWMEAKSKNKDYYPHGYEKEKFIHLSDGTDFLLRIANKYYTHDQSNFVVLELDPAKIVAPRSVVFEVGVPVGKRKGEVKKSKDAKLWPHLYGGGINDSFVVRELSIKRGSDGSFVSVEK